MLKLSLFGVLSFVTCIFSKPAFGEASVLGNAKILQCASNDRKICRLIVSETFIHKTPRPTVGVSIFQEKLPVYRILEILAVKQRTTKDQKTYFIVDAIGKWAVSEKDQANIIDRKPLLRFLKIQKKEPKIKWASSNLETPVQS